MSSIIAKLARPVARIPVLRKDFSASTLPSSLPLISSVRNSHSQVNGVEKDHHIVVADGGALIVCWHPEPQFPYECSLPLPVRATDSHTALKDLTRDVEDIFHTKREQFQRQHLMKLTHTTKHRWFPRPGKKFAKNNKPDREFL